ncbi:MAG: hypothetical protein EOO65_00400 [Methanosarcinales archaeon]|nr:MAG: hypothetical protein EOO65_00400 [Methanosarcinales archaeon]
MGYRREDALYRHTTNAVEAHFKVLKHDRSLSGRARTNKEVLEWLFGDLDAHEDAADAGGEARYVSRADGTSLLVPQRAEHRGWCGTQLDNVKSNTAGNQKHKLHGVLKLRAARIRLMLIQYLIRPDHVAWVDQQLGLVSVACQVPLAGRDEPPHRYHVLLRSGRCSCPHVASVCKHAIAARFVIMLRHPEWKPLMWDAAMHLYCFDADVETKLLPAAQRWAADHGATGQSVHTAPFVLDLLDRLQATATDSAAAGVRERVQTAAGGAATGGIVAMDKVVDIVHAAVEDRGQEACLGVGKDAPVDEVPELMDDEVDDEDEDGPAQANVHADDESITFYDPDPPMPRAATPAAASAETVAIAGAGAGDVGFSEDESDNALGTGALSDTADFDHDFGTGDEYAQHPADEQLQDLPPGEASGWLPGEVPDLIGAVLNAGEAGVEHPVLSAPVLAAGATSSSTANVAIAAAAAARVVSPDALVGRLASVPSSTQPPLASDVRPIVAATAAAVELPCVPTAVASQPEQVMAVRNVFSELFGELLARDAMPDREQWIRRLTPYLGRVPAAVSIDSILQSLSRTPLPSSDVEVGGRKRRRRPVSVSTAHAHDMPTAAAAGAGSSAPPPPAAPRVNAPPRLADLSATASSPNSGPRFTCLLSTVAVRQPAQRGRMEVGGTRAAYAAGASSTSAPLRTAAPPPSNTINLSQAALPQHVNKRARTGE